MQDRRGGLDRDISALQVPDEVDRVVRRFGIRLERLDLPSPGGHDAAALSRDSEQDQASLVDLAFVLNGTGDLESGDVVCGFGAETVK